jgi:hypothetical protein
MFKNWKTSLMGLGSLISGVLLILKGDVNSGFAALSTGIGLILAKDAPDEEPTENEEKKK